MVCLWCGDGATVVDYRAHFLSGRLRKPGGTATGIDQLFLVPQRPYCATGTLADQITYPAIADLGDEQLLAKYVLEGEKFAETAITSPSLLPPPPHLAFFSS